MIYYHKRLCFKCVISLLSCRYGVLSLEILLSPPPPSPPPMMPVSPTPAAPPGFTLLGIQDNPNNDIGLQFPVSLDDCSAICLAISACAGFVYVTEGSRDRQCWPKTTVGANLNAPFPQGTYGATYLRDTAATSGLSWISSSYGSFLPTSPPGAIIASGGVVNIDNVILTAATLAGGSITAAGNGQTSASAFLSTSASPSATSTTWIVAANDGSGYTKMIEVQVIANFI